MAKVTGPMLSVKATGTFGKTITFVCGHFARKAKLRDLLKDQPLNSQNDKFQEGAAVWAELSNEVKNNWRDFSKLVRSKDKCISFAYLINNYQLWLSYYIKFGAGGWSNYPNPGAVPG